MKKLWYKSSALCFEQALPVGNGRLGGMHYAGVDCDRISLNEDTLWSGFPRDKSPEAPYEGIAKAMELMPQGKVEEAEKAILQKSLGEWTESYQPAGNLLIKLKKEDDFTDYYRELDIKNALSASSFISSGYRYTRELFCTAADNVMVYYFKTDAPDSELLITLESPHPNRNTFDDGIFMMQSIAPSYAAPVYYECENPVRYDSFENNRALSYCVGVKPILLNGSCCFENDSIKIDSTEFYLIIDIATNFAGFNVMPADSKIDECALCIQRISDACTKDFKTLKERHVLDYSSLFDRVELCIEGNDFENLATDERLVAYGEQKNDVGLVTLMYDYARYLTIASSRENTQATNLQGIWNEQVRAPWSSNYTLNINTQMNYWHIEKSNLSECHMPLFNLISKLSENGKKTAQKYYNIDGWVSHHNTDLWGQTDPVGKGGRDFPIKYAFWNMSGCWLACHIWEHYCYTEDIDFLRKYYPQLKGAVEFLLNWLKEDENGYLITPLNTSPENCYVLNDGVHALCRGNAMDRAIAAELFESYINAEKLLNFDCGLKKNAENALIRLKPYITDNNIGILEWNTSFKEEDPQHRHISHLWGLYPGNDINSTTPKLQDGAIKVLERKGKDSTGWAIGWRICCWSRLGYGNIAKELVDNMLRMCDITETVYSTGGGVYPNLLVAHPPFQIDGNFAFAAGINEMLIQTIGDIDVPLPSLPEEWSKGGYVKGLKLIGNRTAEIKWQNGEIKEFRIIKA